MLTQQGHEVIAAYATAYTDEANASCKRVGIMPKLFDFDPKKMYADEPTLRVVSAWLDEVKPDIVVTHWPLDSHPHHHVLSSLVWQCYRQKGGWNLYFYEVDTDRESIAFRPERYLDITPVRDITPAKKILL